MAEPSCAVNVRAAAGPAPSSVAPKTVHSLREVLQPDEAVRIIGASHDLDFPPIPISIVGVLRVAGGPMLPRLVLRHHELMSQSLMGDLFRTDRDQFMILVNKFVEFVIDARGGLDRCSRQQLLPMPPLA